MLSIQYINDGRDISHDFYAESDATSARVWDESGDCLMTLVPRGSEWEVIWVETFFANMRDIEIGQYFDSPSDAMSLIEISEVAA